MAITSEIHSLEEIQYKTKVRSFLLIPILTLVFAVAFVSYFPIADKVKSQIKSMTAGACPFDYNNVRFEFLLPKIVIDDVTVPASCFDQMGPPVTLSYVNVGFRFISFSPFGIPFKLETEINRQPLELYYVIGPSGQTVRMKDQKIVLSRFENLMGNFKLGGSIVVDANIQMDSNQNLTAVDIKAQSTDFRIPAQTVMQSFNLPALDVRKFYLETNSENFPQLRVDKLVLGDPDSPVRMNLKGTISFTQPTEASLMKLDGELAFSEQFKEQFPVTLLVNESYTVKDGFYQVTLGGTLGAPQLRPL